MKGDIKIEISILFETSILLMIRFKDLKSAKLSLFFINLILYVLIWCTPTNTSNNVIVFIKTWFWGLLIKWYHRCGDTIVLLKKVQTFSMLEGTIKHLTLFTMTGWIILWCCHHMVKWDSGTFHLWQRLTPSLIIINQALYHFYNQYKIIYRRRQIYSDTSM